MTTTASCRSRTTLAFASLLSLLATACGEDFRPILEKQRTQSSPQASDANDQGNAGTPRAPLPKGSDQTERMRGADPSWLPDDRLQLQDDARVQVNATKIVTDTALGIQVPVLEFSLKDADFVQVLRCSSSFVMRLPTGERITTESLSEPAQLKWAWHEAAGATKDCRFISIRATLGRFEDATVREANFFYVLNPCILDPDAPDDESAAYCSNRIVVTPALAIDTAKLPSGNLPGQDLLSSLQAYSLSRSKTEGQLTQLHVLSLRAQKLAEICQANQKTEARLSAFWNGIGKLAGLAVTTALGSAGGIFAVPLIHAEVQSLVRNLFASRAKLPQSCKQLEETLDTTQSVASEYENSLNELQTQAKKLQELRSAPSAQK